MWTKLIRLWTQFNLWIGRFKPCEPQFFVMNTNLQPEIVQHRLWPEWSVNLKGYTLRGQVLQLRSVIGNHQYHLRMFRNNNTAAGRYHIEIHWEAKWECTWEHAHEIDLRPLSRQEADEFIKTLDTR